MNELDDFRAALRQPPGEPFAEPDLARIMRDGTRLRRRRRVLTGTAGIAAAAAVVLVIVFAVQLRQPPPAPVAQPPAPVSATPVPTTSRPPVVPAIGDVVGTGIRTPAGEIVLYAQAIDVPQLPNVRFGLVAGFRSGDSLQAVLMSNETRGSDLSFGFHATDGGEVIRDQLIPVFGYFSGRAARITTTVHGKTVEAHLATWTADKTVVIFWFDPAEVPNSAVLTPLIAYDGDGKRLTK
ncbi:hypothetical protein [Amycolatopsis sp. NPDC004625]|uniref:hypothetical protein n=1 Tax=Amycolatopsis sp. NPDC004625 TaxID=3154670 RepID=UPI0033BA9EF8